MKSNALRITHFCLASLLSEGASPRRLPLGRARRRSRGKRAVRGGGVVEGGAHQPCRVAGLEAA